MDAPLYNCHPYCFWEICKLVPLWNEIAWLYGRPHLKCKEYNTSMPTGCPCVLWQLANGKREDLTHLTCHIIFWRLRYWSMAFIINRPRLAVESVFCVTNADVTSIWWGGGSSTCIRYTTGVRSERVSLQKYCLTKGCSFGKKFLMRGSYSAENQSYTPVLAKNCLT